MKFHQLIQHLKQLNMAYHVIETRPLGKLVTIERGARMLGIFPDESCDNLLWTSPVLIDLHNAQLQFEHGVEWNIGGDRTWLSPEIDFNIGDLDNLWSTYAVQPIFDPGNYRIHNTNEHSICIMQVTSPIAHRTNRKIPMLIKKVFRANSDPMKYIWSAKELNNYSFVGFDLTTSVTLTDNHKTLPLSTWQLAQLPAGGELIIPTYGKAAVHHFFGSADSPRVSVDPHFVNVKIDAQESFKISIKVHYVTGRMGYYRQVNEKQATLIIRHFDTKPGYAYGDVFVPNLDDPGHCVQAYNDDGKLGDFGEMEYHTPLMMTSKDQYSLEDTHETFCYFGNIEVINKIRHILLGT